MTTPREELEAPPSGDDSCRRSPASRRAGACDESETWDERRTAAVLAGDEAAFLALVKRWHGAMVRVARCYVSGAAVADEVARAAWRAMLEGLASRDPGASLRAFLLGTVADLASARASHDDVPAPREGAVQDLGAGSGAHRSVVAARSEGTGARRPAERVESDELVSLEAAVDRLPRMQRLVFTCRDVAGFSPGEVRAALGLSEVDQRALLHRARSRVRAAMEPHLGAIERVVGANQQA